MDTFQLGCLFRMMSSKYRLVISFAIIKIATYRYAGVIHIPQMISWCKRCYYYICVPK